MQVSSWDASRMPSCQCLCVSLERFRAYSVCHCFGAAPFLLCKGCSEISGATAASDHYVCREECSAEQPELCYVVWFCAASQTAVPCPATAPEQLCGQGSLFSVSFSLLQPFLLSPVVLIVVSPETS